MKLILPTLLFILFAFTKNFSQCFVENDIESCFAGELNVTHGICGNQVFTMTAAPISPIPMCDGSGVLNNPSYYAFVADGSDIFTVVVTPNPETCSDAGGFVGIQGALISDLGCNSNSPFGTCMTDCTQGPFTLSSNEIPEAGQIIIIILDGCNGSACNVEIQITSGWTNNPIIPDTSIINQSSIERESNINCRNNIFTVEPEFEGLCNYLWTLPDGSTRTTNSNTLEVDMFGIPDGVVCVQGFSEDCFPGEFFPADNSICYTFTSADYATINIDGTATSCGLPNGSAYVEIEGEGPFSFLWDNAVADSLNTNIEGGLYTVTVTDGLGCEYVEMITIGQSEALTIEIIEILPSLSTENTGSLSVGMNFGDLFAIVLEGPEGLNEVDTISGSEISFANLAPGVYLLNISDLDSGCSELIQFEIEVITSNREIQSLRNQTLKLFPNPAINVVNVELKNAGNDYTLFSLDGKVVQTGEMINTQIPIANLNSGVYILQIIDTSGSLHYAKLLKAN